jgi:hypothetical protein
VTARLVLTVGVRCHASSHPARVATALARLDLTIPESRPRLCSRIRFSGKTGGCWLNRETESDCLRSVENLEDTIANEAAVFALTAWLGIQFDPAITSAAFRASEV